MLVPRSKLGANGQSEDRVSVFHTIGIEDALKGPRNSNHERGGGRSAPRDVSQNQKNVVKYVV